MNSWSGGRRPVKASVWVDVEHRNGVTARARADAFDWSKRDASEGRTDPAWDIVEWDEWVPAQPGAIPAGEER